MIKKFNVEIPGKNTGKKQGGIRVDDIRTFMNTNADTCEIDNEGKTGKELIYLQNVYRQVVKRMNLTYTVKVMIREDRLFLYRERQ